MLVAQVVFLEPASQRHRHVQLAGEVAGSGKVVRPTVVDQMDSTIPGVMPEVISRVFLIHDTDFRPSQVLLKAIRANFLNEAPAGALGHVIQSQKVF
ncbi:hypothetical protein D3C71_2035140 [compost metagenome]